MEEVKRLVGRAACGAAGRHGQSSGHSSHQEAPVSHQEAPVIAAPVAVQCVEHLVEPHAAPDDIHDGVSLKQLSSTLESMQHDMEQLKGLKEHIEQLVKHESATQQAYMDRRMDRLEDAITKKLQNAMNQNHKEVTEVKDKLEQGLSSPEVRVDVAGMGQVPSSTQPDEWRKTGVKRSGTGAIVAEDDQHVPKRAFVINFRRLVVVDRFFDVVHELIKSTAIAALTLVAADTPRQAGFTLIFISLVFMIYAKHDRAWDATDVDDIEHLLPLVRNDDDPVVRSDRSRNPNKLLKSLSLQRRGLYLWAGWSVHFIIVVATILGWTCLGFWKTLQDLDVSEDAANLHSFEWFSLQFVGGDNDAGILSMQLIILDIMCALELLFEYILWREMFTVMPSAPGNAVWDPRVHGVPRGWLLGLPSMWFTSQDAFQSLKQHAVSAQFGGKASADQYDLFPSELARYALKGDNNRRELVETLQKSKRFDASKQALVDGDQAQTLKISVCFFESQGTHFGDENETFAHPGQVQHLQAGDDEGDLY